MNIGSARIYANDVIGLTVPFWGMIPFRYSERGIDVMKAESFEKAREAAVTSMHEIDRYHNEFKRDTRNGRKRMKVPL